MSALSISQLSKTYGDKTVVKGISLEIQPGEIFGLLGPNGAGKSTTINMITGVTRLEKGAISVFGFDNQKDFLQTRRLTGVMHQEIVFDTFFNVDDGLKLHSGYYGVPDDPAWRNLLIDRLALRPHLKKSMNKLSGGMKRRYMVAKALIHKPRLIILDEPTAGVDVELRQQLWSFVREMNQKEGTTVMLTTHYLEEAQQMCGRVAIMNEGEVIACEETDKLLCRFDQKEITVHLSERVSAVPGALAGLPAKVAEQGTSLVIQLGNEHPLPEVLQRLSTLGPLLKDVETNTPSLEEVFLKLTSKGKS